MASKPEYEEDIDGLFINEIEVSTRQIGMTFVKDGRMDDLDGQWMCSFTSSMSRGLIDNRDECRVRNQ